MDLPEVKLLDQKPGTAGRGKKILRGVYNNGFILSEKSEYYITNSNAL